jgi:ribose 5-phosphate isomerase B
LIIVIIAVGNDHSALDMKTEIKAHLLARDIEIKDFGTDDTASCDYPIYAHKVADAVLGGEADRGILICGTGNGMALAANKIRGIRCVVCSEPYTARLSRLHNNTNMLAFGARVVGSELAKLIVDSWLDAEFEGGRHQTRVDMFESL